MPSRHSHATMRANAATGLDADGRAAAATASRHANSVEREIARAIKGLREDPVPASRTVSLSRRQKLLFTEIRRLRDEMVASAESGSVADEQRVTDYAIHHRDALIELGRSRSPEVISTLSAFGRHSEPQVRMAAATALGHTSHRNAMPPLLRMLQDVDLQVVRSAVEALGQFAEPRLVRPLMAVAQATPRMAHLIFETVCAHEELARQQLLDIVCNRREHCLHAAARALVRFPDTATVKALGLLIEADDHVESAVVACASLKAIANPQGLHFLRLGLVSRHPRVRLAAADALQVMQHSSCVRPLVKLLGDELPALRLAAVRALGLHTDARAIGPLSELLRVGDYRLTLAVIEALGRIGDPAAAPSLLPFLRDPEYRDPALIALKQIRRAEQLVDLTTALSLTLESSAETRRHAIDFLGRWGDETVVPQLSRCLIRDPQVDVRVAAARALGELKSRRALAALRDAMDDELDVRCQVAIALGSIGDASARPLLERLVGDPAPQVVYHAVGALGSIGAKDSADLLVPLLNSKHTMVEQKARRVLLDCGDRRAAETLLGRCRRAARHGTERLAGMAVIGRLLPRSALGWTFVPLLVLVVGGSSFWWLGGAEQNEPVAAIETGNARGVAFGTGNTFYVTYDNRMLLQWSSAGEQLRSETLKAPGPVLTLDDGQLLIGQFRSVVLSDPVVGGEGRLLCELDEPIRGLLATSDQSVFVAYGTRGHVAVLDANEDYRTESLRLPVRSIATVSLLPGTKQILVGEPAGLITAWQLRPPKRVATLAGDESLPILCSDVDAEGTYAVFGTRQSQVLLFVLADPRRPYLLGDEGSQAVTSVAISSDGKLLAAGDSGGSLRLWDLPEANERVVSDSGIGRVDALRISTDGTRLLAASNEQGAVLVVDTAQAKILQRLEPK